MRVAAGHLISASLLRLLQEPEPAETGVAQILHFGFLRSRGIRTLFAGQHRLFDGLVVVQNENLSLGTHEGLPAIAEVDK